LIKPYLDSPESVKNIMVYDVIGSTNREAKRQAAEGAAHGTVILADSQSDGVGRHNRPFFSPPGVGIYMSFILSRSVMGYDSPTIITSYAAVRVCEAIEKVYNVKPSIKWVNDIYLNGKKICGILAEGVSDPENPGVAAVILGIGVNVSTKPADFPEGLRGRAGSLYPNGDPPVSRNVLAAEIINSVLSPDMPDETEIFKRYRARLFMLGAGVTVIQGSERFKATTLDIDNHGRLLVRLETGEVRALIWGDIELPQQP